MTITPQQIEAAVSAAFAVVLARPENAAMMTNATRDLRIEARLLAGDKYKVIAEDFGISMSSVSYIARNLGLRRRKGVKK